MKISMQMALTITALLFVAACSVTEQTPTSISIRHDAVNDLFVQQKADSYCQDLGYEKGVKVQMTPAESTYYIPTVVSRFDCV